MPSDVRTGLPETRFARSGDVSIAYQIFGEGQPIDLVFVPGIIYHLEASHEIPGVTDFFRRLGNFARVIVFDKRGQGLSDRVPVATMDERADDIRAVMDAAGAKRVVLCGYSEGALLAAYFTAFHAERVSHLVLIAGLPKFCRSDDYPYAPSEDVIRKSLEHYATGALFKAAVPSWKDDPHIQANAARFERLSCSPGNYRALTEMNIQLDVRALLPQIRMPTLVLHNRTDGLAHIEGARYFAKYIVDAKLVEYDHGDHWVTASDYVRLISDIEEFVTGERHGALDDEERTLATVMFTDIVDSTRHAASEGDAAWRRRLDEHDGIVRRLVEQYRGRLIKSTGDGILALFDGPGRAVRCALSIEPALARLKLSARAGLHTGEVVERGDDVAGIAVHAAARVMSEAAPGEVLVSRVVTDLVAGSGVQFRDCGESELKGLPGRWQLFAAAL